MSKELPKRLPCVFSGRSDPERENVTVLGKVPFPGMPGTFETDYSPELERFLEEHGALIILSLAPAFGLDESGEDGKEKSSAKTDTRGKKLESEQEPRKRYVGVLASLVSMERNEEGMLVGEVKSAWRVEITNLANNEHHYLEADWEVIKDVLPSEEYSDDEL